MLPVAGAALAILAGCARPRIFVARLLAHPALLAIGLVSYAWYLWHWPILSVMRINAVRRCLAAPERHRQRRHRVCARGRDLRWVELPIRRWRRSGGGVRPGRVVAAGVAACLVTASVAGLAEHAQYLMGRTEVAARYGIDGKDVLDNGCRMWTSNELPAAGLEGSVCVLLGDSQADAISGTLTRAFDEQNQRLITLARANCALLPGPA